MNAFQALFCQLGNSGSNTFTSTRFPGRALSYRPLRKKTQLWTRATPKSLLSYFSLDGRLFADKASNN